MEKHILTCKQTSIMEPSYMHKISMYLPLGYVLLVELGTHPSGTKNEVVH